jgi:hypothetical protein
MFWRADNGNNHVFLVVSQFKSGITSANDIHQQIQMLTDGTSSQKHDVRHFHVDNSILKDSQNRCQNHVNEETQYAF